MQEGLHIKSVQGQVVGFTPSTVVAMPLIAQGSSYNERVGNRVHFERISVRGTFHPNANNNTLFYRVVCLIKHPNLLDANIFDLDANDYTNSQFNYLYESEIRVLVDKTYTLPTPGSGTNYAAGRFDFDIPLDMFAEYTPAGTTPTTWKFQFHVLTNVASTLNYNQRIYFHNTQ